MALVFDRCEKASSKVDSSVSDNFEVDIQAFVHSQEQEHRPFFSDDSELDNLVRTIELSIGACCGGGGGARVGLLRCVTCT